MNETRVRATILGSAADSSLTVEAGARLYRVALRTNVGVVLGVGGSLFDSLRDLRRHLASRSIALHIAAFHRDAWASWSDRLYGGGTRVWLRERDSSPAHLRSLDCLDPIAPEDTASELEQRTAHTEWLFDDITPPHSASAKGGPANAVVWRILPLTDPRLMFSDHVCSWWHRRTDGSLAEESGQRNPATVTLIGEGGEKLEGAELLVRFVRGCSLALAGPGVRTYIAEGKDLFAAIGHLRQELEKVGLTLAVRAAARSAWRCEPRGRLVNHMEVGRNTNQTAVAMSLSPWTNELTSVHEQCDYHRRWLASLVTPDDAARAKAQTIREGYVHAYEPGILSARFFEVGIAGSWRVSEGTIQGEFLPNPRYKSRPRRAALPLVTAAEYERMCAAASVGYTPHEDSYPLEGR